MVFTLQGDVERPGIHELPLGTPLSELLFAHGGGGRAGGGFKMAFPGGFSAPPVGAGSLGVALDYDGLRDEGSDLGSGAVVAVGEGVSAPALAAELAAYFHAGSCGKCRPCRDGTARTLTMLERLEVLDSKSVDLAGQSMPAPKRRYALRVLGQADFSTPAGISYTDMTSGLAKIEEFCEFYKYRGDCHHSTEAASVIQRLIALFRPEFEARLAPDSEGARIPAAVAVPAS
jgi:NADH-quinone oxidoreductase subunit F